MANVANCTQCPRQLFAFLSLPVQRKYAQTYYLITMKLKTLIHKGIKVAGVRRHTKSGHNNVGLVTS